MTEPVVGCAIRFERPSDGGVDVIAVTPDGQEIVFRFGLEKWTNFIAAVSAQGAAPERVALVRNFHMYGAQEVEPVDAGGWDGNGSPTDEFPAPIHT